MPEVGKQKSQVQEQNQEIDKDHGTTAEIFESSKGSLLVGLFLPRHEVDGTVQAVIIMVTFEARLLRCWELFHVFSHCKGDSGDKLGYVSCNWSKSRCTLFVAKGTEIGSPDEAKELER